MQNRFLTAFCGSIPVIILLAVFAAVVDGPITASGLGVIVGIYLFFLAVAYRLSAPTRQPIARRRVKKNKLAVSLLASSPFALILAGVASSAGAFATANGMAVVGGIYALLLGVTYKMASGIENDNARRYSSAVSDDYQSSGSSNRFADTGSGFMHRSFADSDMFRRDDSPAMFSHDDSSDDMFGHDDGPSFNIDGTPMCGGIDMNGHVFGQTD